MSESVGGETSEDAAAERRAAAVALAERTGANLYDLEVVAVSDLSAAMRRITFAAAELAELRYDPGQDLMLSVALAGQRVVRRRYTIRSHRPEDATVDVDIVLHGDGPGARWAAGVAAGDRIEAIGPRGKITLVADVDWHLFVGDAAYLPAATSMAAAVPEGEQAISIIQVDPEDVGVFEPPAGAATWVASDEQLLSAVESLVLPDGRGHAYIGGESKIVLAVRDALEAKGLLRDDISPKPYWRADKANQDHGEPERE